VKSKKNGTSSKNNTPSKKNTPKKKNTPRLKKKDSETKSKKNNTKPKKVAKKVEDDEDAEQNDDFEELLLPGQKYPTPPQGDACRAYYESLLEQKSDSFLALKWCVEYGCLDSERAQSSLVILTKKKKK
jgi:hypothetical protein